MYICWQIIELLHSRGQLPCKIIGTKDIVYIRKEVCSRGITGRLECLYPCPHPTGHVRYINIPTWLSGQNCKFFNSRKRHGYKENNFPNLKICLQRLDAMSEYWYIDGDLFRPCTGVCSDRAIVISQINLHVIWIGWRERCKHISHICLLFWNTNMAPVTSFGSRPRQSSFECMNMAK